MDAKELENKIVSTFGWVYQEVDGLTTMTTEHETLRGLLQEFADHQLKEKVSELIETCDMYSDLSKQTMLFRDLQKLNEQ